MSESDDKKRKKDKKEKKAKKEKKKARESASSGVGGSSSFPRKPIGLEEVYEDEYEDGGRRYDEDGAAVDMDELDAPPTQRGGRRQVVGGHANGGLELDDDQPLDDDLMAEMEAHSAELDLDYHPPPPKTTQQVVLGSISFLLLGLVEVLLFAYLSDPIELWSLVTSACCLLLVGVLGLRAASDNQVASGQHYRFGIQVYVVLILLLATINIVITNTEPCIAPCISTTPCTTPTGATLTCSHQLVNTLAISAFGLFFPLFLLCLPCYLGSGIHIENLQSQLAPRQPTASSSDAKAQAQYRAQAPADFDEEFDEEERKY